MKFDTQLFAKYLRVKAADLNVTYTDAAKEIGISKATFSRAANGAFLPDIETFAKCCHWLKAPMMLFFNQ